MDLDEIHERADSLLVGAGQRYTKERRRIVEALATAQHPVTVESLREVSPTIPLSSAYRNLAVLERVGVVDKVRTSDDHSRYELSELLTRHHHHHLVCTDCGAVEDFTVPASLERSLARSLAEVALGSGFRTAGHRLDLVGVCGSCA